MQVFLYSIEFKAFGFFKIFKKNKYYLELFVVVISDLSANRDLRDFAGKNLVYFMCAM